MLRTVLLMDSSEAMNSSSDYLPSYLLALRPPLLRLVEKYLDSTPLASLGIVVMRDGISHRLLPCTTNRNEIVDVLERDVFLHGGSGTMSLENGLRVAMSELVDVRKVAALAANHGSTSKTEAPAALSLAKRNAQTTWKGAATQLNVWIISASVTLIDPADVFKVINTLAALSVRIHVVSLVGAVHVFDVCAVETGGTLYCPMNYDHLLRIVDQLATRHRTHTATAGAAAAKRKQQQRRKRQRNAITGELRAGDGRADTEEEDDDDAPYLIPIGCPVYLKAPPPSSLVGETTAPSSATAPDTSSFYLACPQCHLIQLSVPTTCPMCRLLLCSAPMLYSTYVSHNTLVPAARRLRVVSGAESASAKKEKTSVLITEGSTAEDLSLLVKKKTKREEEEGAVEVTENAPARCALCMTRVPADAARGANARGSTGIALTEGPHVWQCSACASYRCGACNDFVVKTIGMCPQCLALR